jgi:hypothetical protein
MARWVLDCKNCSEAFAYSLIPDTLTDYYLPLRPAFPPAHQECECPTVKPNLPTTQST